MNIWKQAALSATSMIGIAVAGAGCLLVQPAFAQDAPAGANASDTEQENANSRDIVVTARKRSEDILKTPVAVSALTSDDISKRGIVSLNDVMKNTPGMNISSVNSGRNDRSFQQVILRGFAPTTTTSVLTATFIDGVPVASATALNSISDPERIEVLRGPQAAYFGRNTFAGAVNVINKQPKDTLGGQLSAMVGTRNNYDIQAALEGPLIPDVLSFRVTGRSFAKDGSYSNQAALGQTLGDQSTRTGTLLLVAKPTDRLTIKGFGLLTSDRDGPSAQGMLSAYEVRSNNGITNVPYVSGNNNGVVVLPSVANCTLNGLTTGLSASETRVNRPFICGAVPSLPAGFSPAQNTVENALLSKSLADGSYRYVTPSQGVDGYGLKRGYYHLHLNVDYELGDSGVTLSSLTGYNNEYYSELADADNYDTTKLRNPANPTGSNPNLTNYYDLAFLIERATRDFSQELRASYDKGPLSAVVGASYIITKTDSEVVGVSGEIVSGIARPSTTRGAPQKSRTVGLFFGSTYEFTDKFKLSLEGRYQIDKIYAISGGRSTGLVISPTNQYGLPAGTFPPLTEYFSKTFKNFLPRIIAQYEFNNNVMTYASFSKGANISLASFNTSFLNGSPTVVAGAQSIGLGVIVQPEKLNNYEIGLKGKFLDGRLRASLTAYYAQWRNQQNTRTTSVVDEAPPTGTGVVQFVTGVANSGSVNLKGIELDLNATPVDEVQINLSASVNDSKILSFVDPSISKLTGVFGDGFRGNQMPNSSKYSANAGIQYGTEIAGVENARWFIRGDVSYKSKIFTDAANLTWIKGRTEAAFRVGVSKDAFSLEAFVLNAFNNRDYVSITTNIVSTPTNAISDRLGYVNLGLPDLRTFGVRLTGKF